MQSIKLYIGCARKKEIDMAYMNSCSASSVRNLVVKEVKMLKKWAMVNGAETSELIPFHYFATEQIESCDAH